MPQIQLFEQTIALDMKTGPDIRDITRKLSLFVQESGVVSGILHVFVPGATGSVTTIEYEPGVVADLCRAITELAPPGQVYSHEQAWHDGNGHSHVQSALLGPSISIPVRASALRLGTWQQVVVINHDNGNRNRKVELTLMGTRS